ncbi:MAG: tetratricopeptide repeat protein [Pseudomonadota bacterium]
MKGLVLVTVAAFALAFVSGGAAPLARVLLAAGFPGAAAQVFDDPAWRAVASFRAGDFERASDDFRATGDYYNLGTAEAHAGNYAAALEAFDQAIAMGHPLAQANFDVVAAYYAGLGIGADTLGLFPERRDGPKMESFVARGDGRAAGTGSEATNNTTMLGLAELQSRGRLGVRRVFDDRFIVADDRWLEQLSDVPGSYLKARIAQEHKRRQKLGLSPPDPEDPR